MSAARRRDKISRGWGDDLPVVPVSKIDAELYGALREVEGDRATLLDNQIHIGSFILTSTGLQIDNSATQDEWNKIGEILFRLEGSIQWLIGDWLVYGEDLKYGDISAIAQALGREPETLHQYASVCRKVKSWIRIHDLSYGHHKLITKLSEEAQKEALAYAAENGLSVADFRQYLRGEQPALSVGDDHNIDAVTRDLKKFMQRDPITLKPHERTLFLNRLAEMERMIADAKRRLADS